MQTTASLARPLHPIVLGGLACGTCDITAAIIVYGLLRGRTAVWVLQTVASGLLGMDAFQGGLATGALGLLCHFFIAFGAATVYYLASRKLEPLTTKPFIFGPLYGIAVYWFMNLIVVPLSAFPFKLTRELKWTLIGVTIHIFCVGLPIALANRKNTLLSEG